MTKFICSIKTTVYITKEVYEDIEIDAPDEVQAEEDAITAAELMDKKIWINNIFNYKDNKYDIDYDFEIEEIEKKEINF